MYHINVPQKGRLLFICRHTDIIENIAKVINLSVDKNLDLISVSYNEESKLKEILIKVYEGIHNSNHKLITCAFRTDNYDEESIQEKEVEILRNLTSFSSLYQWLINQHIVKLILDGDLYSLCQPIYDIQNEELFGYEFLLRGKIGNDIISPLYIYETAYELGLQYLLDARARESSVKKAATLINKDNIKIFINFLPTAITDTSNEYNLNNTFKIAEESNVELSNIVLEVVETENLKEIEDLTKTFIFYKSFGTRLAMDDVGAGYSSLNNLHKLLPDYVKIDRDLISDCHVNSEKLQIIQSIVSLCKSLDIKILAEGIEKQEELDVCKSIGINLAQGYYLGRPSEFEVLEETNFFNKK